MHLVLLTYAEALATVTLRAPPAGATAPRVWEAFREPASLTDYQHVGGFAKEHTR